jgi:pimeloyl-ACP methyl ester carboxylesterase
MGPTSMATIEPFKQRPFLSLPATPARPHPYFDTAAREVTTRGRMGTLRIHYREAGAGPPLLLVHGLMTTSYSWRYVIEPFGRHFRLIMPDLPGAGRSEGPGPGRYRAADLAAWIGDFQAALSIEGCAAVGNSMGGYLCRRRAIAVPEAFSRLVDIHSPVVPDVRLDLLSAILRVPGARALTAWLARRDPPRWAHRNVHYHDEGLKSLEEAREYGAPLGTPEGARAFASYLAETMSPADLRAFARALEARRGRGEPFPVPLLLLYARRDPLVSPRNGEALHALVPDAEMVWLDESSHFAHVDSPDRVADALLPFLLRAPIGEGAPARPG